MHVAILILFIIVCQGVGFLGSIPNIRAIPDWYNHLERPSWTPPNRVFAPVWTSLYLLMAIAAWRCWLLTGFSPWALPFAVQLGLNLAWSWIFFGFRRIGLALVEMSLLWGAIVWCLSVFLQIDKAAGILMVPYLLWVTYAYTLNAGYWLLNRNKMDKTVAN